MMMFMLGVDCIEKEYGLLAVLKDVSFSIGSGQKVALIGNNGSGKSTLLRILASIETSDRGRIRFDPDARIGYVPQDIAIERDEIVANFLRGDRFEHDGTFEQRMNVLLKGFGFEASDREKKISMLSGGQKRKVFLVRMFLSDANIFLLDEPTNDLDLPAIVWLERLLAHSDATVLVASHDRRFLDHVIEKIIEIDDRTHTASMTNGTYSEYLVACAKKRERLRLAYKEQREEIARLEDRAEALKKRGEEGNAWEGSDNDTLLRGFKRNRSKGSGKRAKAIEKRIGQIEMIEKPFERKPLEILLPESGKHGNRDIVLENVVAGYPNGFHLHPFSANFLFGKRYGFIGLNGSGKSTLLRTMIGALLPLQGDVRIGSGVRFGHLDQEHDALDLDATPLDLLRKRAGLIPEKAFLLLDIFGLDPKRAHDPIRLLSPGGRVRLILALFSALEVNTLVLDEPTNHLDLEALSALEETLETFKGTVILVSHDRVFIERIRLDAMYLLNDNDGIGFVDDYRAYVQRIERETDAGLGSLH
jgi:ATPase subunit of ABC transporter with duplicated ATPase domains